MNKKVEQERENLGDSIKNTLTKHESTEQAGKGLTTLLGGGKDTAGMQIIGETNKLSLQITFDFMTSDQVIQNIEGIIQESEIDRKYPHARLTYNKTQYVYTTENINHPKDIVLEEMRIHFPQVIFCLELATCIASIEKTSVHERMDHVKTLQKDELKHACLSVVIGQDNDLEAYNPLMITKQLNSILTEQVRHLASKGITNIRDRPIGVSITPQKYTSKE